LYSAGFSPAVVKMPRKLLVLAASHGMYDIEPTWLHGSPGQLAVSCRGHTPNRRRLLQTCNEIEGDRKSALAELLRGMTSHNLYDLRTLESALSHPHSGQA
jgi:hypothetical protein